MTAYVLSAFVVAVALALRWYAGGDRLSPDGLRYFALARGIPQPSPFHRRWLLPRLLGTSLWRWRVVTWAATIAMGPLLCAYTGSPWAAALFAGLPLVRVAAMFPVLVDAPAMALALGSAVAWQRGHSSLAAILWTLSGTVRETGPVFAVCFAGTPWAILGLVGVPWFMSPGPKDGDVYCGRPLLETAARIWRERRHEPLSLAHAAGWGPLLVLAPLGAAWDRATLLAGLAIAVAYAQLVVATDKGRLYLWAAPAVIALAVRSVPAPWLAAACVVGCLVPYRDV